MITLSQVKWNKYRNFEGPVFVGNMPVPGASQTSPFHAKVLAITAAAEGGGFNATQMWDRGLLSVGAIQFIDAGTFNVCNLLGEVADKCGLHLLLEKLQPALDMCNATFSKGSDGKWRFVHNGVRVTTTAAQKMLYFGDVSGNALGTFTDAKRLRVKTWVVCMANVWDIPGSTDVQMEFTLRNLKSGFVWGNLRSELFTPNVSEEGYVGATKAMLLAYAVNAPAVVVKMYDAARNNGKEKLSAEWCLHVLRHVIVNGGIDVWKSRWGTKLPYIEAAFGVKFPSYNQLISGTWTITKPAPPPEPVVEPEPIVEEPAPAPVEPEPVLEPEPNLEPQPEPTPDPEPVPEPGPAPLVVPQTPHWVTIVLTFVKVLIEVLARALGKR